MNFKLVSIIIPSFNSQNTIERTIDSLICQTYFNWEALIIDDNSIDDTKIRVEKYEQNDTRIKFYKKPIELKLGVSTSRNYGLKICQGDFVIFLDSDDTLENFALEKRIHSIQNSEFIVFPMNIIYNNSEVKTHYISKSDYLKEFTSNNFMWGVMCTTWNKSFLLKIKGFNENLIWLEDPEIHIRAMLKTNNYRVFYDDIADSSYYMTIKPKHMLSKNYYLSLSEFFTVNYSNFVKYNKLEYNRNQKKILRYFILNFAKYLKYAELLKLLNISEQKKIIYKSELVKIKTILIAERLFLKIVRFCFRKMDENLLRILDK